MRYDQISLASIHTARVSMNVIRETLAGRLISRSYNIPWTPRLSDLSPAIFYGVPEVQSKPRKTTHYTRIKRGHTTWKSSDSGLDVDKCDEKCINVEWPHLSWIINIIKSLLLIKLHIFSYKLSFISFQYLQK